MNTFLIYEQAPHEPLSMYETDILLNVILKTDATKEQVGILLKDFLNKDVTSKSSIFNKIIELEGKSLEPFSYDWKHRAQELLYEYFNNKTNLFLRYVKGSGFAAGAIKKDYKTEPGSMTVSFGHNLSLKNLDGTYNVNKEEWIDKFNPLDLISVGSLSEIRKVIRNTIMENNSHVYGLKRPVNTIVYAHSGYFKSPERNGPFIIFQTNGMVYDLIDAKKYYRGQAMQNVEGYKDGTDNTMEGRNKALVDYLKSKGLLVAILADTVSEINTFIKTKFNDITLFMNFTNGAWSDNNENRKKQDYTVKNFADALADLMNQNHDENEDMYA